MAAGRNAVPMQACLVVVMRRVTSMAQCHEDGKCRSSDDPRWTLRRPVSRCCLSLHTGESTVADAADVPGAYRYRSNHVT